jgi:hypothetical protein
MNQQVRLKNVKKSKKSLGRTLNEVKETNEGLGLDMVPESHKFNNLSKSSFHHPRAWREFLEVKKEINAMNDKQFISTDSVLASKVQNFKKLVPGQKVLDQSESFESTHTPTIMHALLKFDENDVHNLGIKKIKIKAGKDLRTLQATKDRVPSKSKSKGLKKSKKVDKICWDYIETKGNIRKYMKKKRRKMIKEDIKEKFIDYKKQTKIYHNLRELHKFTRLQTKRVGTFKERSASTQHKLFTGRRNNGFILDAESASFMKIPRENVVSNRKLSSLYPNDLKTKLKRMKRQRMKSSSSTMSTKLSTEFYLEYFKILKSVNNPNKYNNTLVAETSNSQSRRHSKSNKRRRPKLRPKSAPGLRKIININKYRRGTVDAENLGNYNKKHVIAEANDYQKSFQKLRKSYSPGRAKKHKTKKRKSGKKKQVKEALNNTGGIRILNLNFKNRHEFDHRITLQQARAAFFIFMVWKFK